MHTTNVVVILAGVVSMAVAGVVAHMLLGLPFVGACTVGLPAAWPLTLILIAILDRLLGLKRR